MLGFTFHKYDTKTVHTDPISNYILFYCSMITVLVVCSHSFPHFQHQDIMSVSSSRLDRYFFQYKQTLHTNFYGSILLLLSLILFKKSFSYVFDVVVYTFVFITDDPEDVLQFKKKCCCPEVVNILCNQSLHQDRLRR